MSFLDLAKKRCSTRAYQPVPVSQEHIDAIVEAARVAPTAANRQPVRILQVTSEEGLASLAKAANVFDAPLAFVVCADGEKAWKRPKLIIFNLILTAAIIAALIMGLASSAILFGVGTAIALLVNYPKNKVQRNVISSIAPDMINVIMMVLGAGVLMGVLNGPEDAGMSNAIAQFLVSVIPESMGRFFAVVIAVVSAPGTYLLNNDAFYYGVLPPLAATAQAYGFTDLQVGFAALMGQAFHFLSPLVPFIYLLMDKTEITLAEYQGYIFKWCIGIFVIFMGMGLALGYLPIL